MHAESERKEHLRDILLRCGIRVVLDPTVTSEARLTRSGYVIRIHPLAVQDPETEYRFLLHEVAHILRGDCLRPETSERERLASNIAEDALIHESYRQHDIEVMDRFMSAISPAPPDLPECTAGVITFDRLRAICPAIDRPAHTYTTEELARIVAAILPEPRRRAGGGAKNRQGQQDESASGGVAPEQRHGEQTGQGIGGLRPCDGASREDGISQEAAESIHAQTVLRLRRESITAGLAKGDLTEAALKTYRPEPLPKISRILDAIRRASKNGELVRVRTYLRPGRVEGLRGVSRQSRLRVAVIFDLSGSMENHRELLSGVAVWLARTHTVSCIVHDTTAQKVPVQPSQWPRMGGGTLAQPAIDLAAQLDPDVIVWASDREFADLHTARWPRSLEGRLLVWAVPCGERLEVMQPVAIREGKIEIVRRRHEAEDI